MVEEKDAEDLLECYSNSESNKLFNSDNCTSNFIYKSLGEMKNCIKSWIDQYNEKYYVRFSIVDKLNDKAIGTIEFFAKPVDYKGVFKVGLLRLDVAPKYENEESIVEILDKVNNNFYDDFEVKHIITKAIPVANQRIAALKKERYIELEDKTIVPFDSYFIRDEHYEV
jgi:RimJ/RimL family protein N-acetyltransferase